MWENIRFVQRISCPPMPMDSGDCQPSRCLNLNGLSSVEHLWFHQLLGAHRAPAARLSQESTWFVPDGSHVAEEMGARLMSSPSDGHI